MKCLLQNDNTSERKRKETEIDCFRERKKCRKLPHDVKVAKKKTFCIILLDILGPAMHQQQIEKSGTFSIFDAILSHVTIN